MGFGRFPHGEQRGSCQLRRQVLHRLQAKRKARHPVRTQLLHRGHYTTTMIWSVLLLSILCRTGVQMFLHRSLRLWGNRSLRLCRRGGHQILYRTLRQCVRGVHQLRQCQRGVHQVLYRSWLLRRKCLQHSWLLRRNRLHQSWLLRRQCILQYVSSLGCNCSLSSRVLHLISRGLHLS